MENNTTTNRIPEALAFIGRMEKKRVVTGNDIGVKEANRLISAERKLWNEAYRYAERAHNNRLVDDVLIPRDGMYAAVRELFAIIGPVNGYKLVANDAAVVMAVSMAAKTVNKWHGEADLKASQRSNAQAELRKLEGVNGVNPERIEELEKRIATLDDELEELREVPDMRTAGTTRVPFNTWRQEFEHYLADVVNGVRAKSSEELAAEEEARKAAKRLRRQAKHEAK